MELPTVNLTLAIDIGTMPSNVCLWCLCVSRESVFPNFGVYELQYFGVTKNVKRFED